MHLIAAYHAQGYSVEDALVAATRRLQGAFALCLPHDAYPGHAVLCPARDPTGHRRRSNATYLASDVHAFARHTPQVVFLDDGEYAMLRPHDYTVKSLRHCHSAAALARALPGATARGR